MDISVSFPANSAHFPSRLSWLLKFFTDQYTLRPVVIVAAEVPDKTAYTSNTSDFIKIDLEKQFNIH